MQVNGAALKALREKDGWTVSELAREVGIERSHLSNVEAGRRGIHPEKVRDLARLLDVPISALTREMEVA